MPLLLVIILIQRYKLSDISDDKVWVGYPLHTMSVCYDSLNAQHESTLPHHLLTYLRCFHSKWARCQTSSPHNITTKQITFHNLPCSRSHFYSQHVQQSQIQIKVPQHFQINLTIFDFYFQHSHIGLSLSHVACYSHLLEVGTSIWWWTIIAFIKVYIIKKMMLQKIKCHLYIYIKITTSWYFHIYTR